MGAFEEIALTLFHDERILRCWKVGFGFLIMTTLRCIHVWRKPELFARPDWHTGPTFFFYNLAPPQVLFGRFVQLSEAYDEGVGAARFRVHDAAGVAQEIDAARVAGQREWERRRAQAQSDLRRLTFPRVPPGTTVVVREIVKVRCTYCGNLVESGRRLCPFCGAPQR